MWQYYTLGKLTHYLADAFTYPHNENYPDSMLCHHQYETDLRAYLEEYLADRALRREKSRRDVTLAPCGGSTASIWPAWRTCARTCSSS